MVEINCETDFVARSENFRKFAHEIALQIAASNPTYIREEEIPEEVLENERNIGAARAREEGKPDAVVPRIVEGYLKKFKEETVLMNQPYIRDESKKIQELFNETLVVLGENLVIRRFQRWQLGEES
jgi:elongation factor Ts